MLSLARHTDPSRIQWTGTALCEWAYSSTEMAAEMVKFMPIYAGPPRGPAELHDHTHIQRFQPNASVAIGRLVYDSEVIISWGTYHLDVMLHNYIKALPLKSVLVSHCEGPPCELAPYEAGATHFAAVCNAAKQVFKPETREKCTVIYNGADVHRLTPRITREKVREAWGFGENDRLIGYLGRFSPEKNPTALAKGVKELPKNYHAVFVGDGWRATETQKEVKELIPDQHFFVPAINQVGDALQAFDAMVLPSYTEAFSLSMIEAWLSDIPIAVTPVGALRELEEIHGRVAIHLPYDPSAAQVATAIQEALSDKGTELAHKCRKIAWRNYTSTAMAERWMSYLENITGREPYTPPLVQLKRSLIDVNQKADDGKLPGT